MDSGCLNQRICYNFTIQTIQAILKIADPGTKRCKKPAEKINKAQVKD